MSAPPLPPALRERVLGAVRARPAATLPAARRGRAAALALSFAATALLAACVRGDAADRRPIGALVAGGLWGALVLAAVARTLFARRGEALWPSRSALAMTAWGAPAALAFFPLLNAALWPLPGPHGGRAQGAFCLIASAVLGGIALGGLLIAYRKSDPVSPRLSGAALGALAGAWVAFSQQFRCPFGDPVHVLSTHVLPSLLLAGLGALLGARVLDPVARGGTGRAAPGGAR